MQLLQGRGGKAPFGDLRPRLARSQRDAGKLSFDDAELAAEDLWGLILSAPRNQALHLPDRIPTRPELARYINNGLRVFLKAYSTDPAHDLAQLHITTGTP